MEKIAIISPGRLPVPSIEGGAVEQLITYIIDENEKEHKFDIDLYTIYNKKININSYENTNIIFINNLYITRIIYKLFNSLFSLLHINKIFSCYAINVRKKLNKTDKIYKKIIVENNIIVYNELFKKYKFFNNSDFYFHMHNVIYEDTELKYMFNQISSSCKALICVSDYIKKYFNKISVINNNKVLYNCIDFSKYNYELNSNKNKFRNEFDILVSSYNYIFTGRCVEDKGVMELIKAFIKLNKKYKNVSLSICGIDLKKPNSFEKEIIRIAKRNNIKLFKYTNQEVMTRIVSCSDCVVIPSKCEEAFGVVALEAMAMKKTIISTNAGGLVEPLNCNCSVIIDRNNLQDNLYNAMEKVYKDKEYSKKIAENAYKRIKGIPEFDKSNYLNCFYNCIYR